MHIDMNAFFASVEQRCNPALRGKPIAVVGSAHRTVVTTASYEARAFGVKTGMNRFEAKRACPSLIFVVGDNRKYTDTSVRMLEILKGFSPCVEAYSIDEAFVDVSGLNSLFATPEALGTEAKERVKRELGITCSVGIAPNKLLAKLASDMHKPDGLFVVRPADVASLLEELPVGELWGIGPRLTVSLASLGVRTCGQLGRAPVSVLRKRFGIIGERLSLMGRGIYDSPIVPMGEEAGAKSVGHSMTLPRDITDRRAVRRYLLRLSEMVGSRARAHGLKGRKVSLTIRYADFFTFSRVRTLPLPTNDTHAIYRSALAILDSLRLRSAIRLLGVSISDITAGSVQMNLFEDDKRRERLLGAVDEINGRMGRFTLTWASLLEDDGPGPGVISPAWRPAGVKNVDVS